MLEDHTIDTISLVRTETGQMILLKAAPKFEQNQDVEGFLNLNSHTTLSDYVQYQLPDGLSESGFLAGSALGYNHTEYLSDTEENLEGCETQAFLFQANHDLYTVSDIAEAEENGNSIREEDQTANIWYVCFAKEDGKRAYVLFLNDRYFDKEDIISMARNIKFKEGAFD